jgi:hypothetical protein
VNQYDAIVIGAGFSGLLAAKKLMSQNKKVAILERQPQTTYDSVSTLGEILNIDLALGLPNESTVLSQLYLDLNLGPLPDKKTFDFKVFESSEFKPFYGFSDHRFASTDALNYFNHREFYDLNETLFIDKNHFGNELLEKVIFGAEVARLEAKAEGGWIVTTNGEKSFFANEVFVTLPFEECKAWLPANLLPAKVQMKLKKSNRWGAVHLVQYFSETIYDTDKLLLFFPTQRDGCEPALGRLFNLEAGQMGIWTCMIPSDQVADSEAAAQTVRFLKKCITKAFPEKVDVTKQKISLVPEWWSQPIEISNEIVAAATQSKIHLTDKSLHSQLSPIGALANGIYAHFPSPAGSIMLESTAT